MKRLLTLVRNLLGRETTAEINYRVALAAAGELGDQLVDVLHDQLRAGVDADTLAQRVEAAGTQLRAAAWLLHLAHVLHVEQARHAAGSPERRAARQQIGEARRATEETLRNVARALAGRALWEPPPAPPEPEPA